MKNILGLIFISLFIFACEKNHMPVFETSHSALTRSLSSSSGDIVGFDQVKSIFGAKCTMCHNGSGHPKNWTIYETSKADLNKLNNRLFVTKDMPAKGGGMLTANEKTKILAWINAGGPLLSVTAIPSAPLAAAPSAIEETVKNQCLGCHGSAAMAMDTPNLFGLNKAYLIKQINNFKSEERKDTIMGSMGAIVKNLSDQEIENISTYLSHQSKCLIDVAKDSGGGNIEAGKGKAQMCLGCHVVDSPLNAPLLDGQKNSYLKINLHNFKNLKRIDPSMNGLAASLNDEDINDLTAYFNSQRNCK